MDIITSIAALQDTPLPTILVIIGSIFLLLSFAGGVVGKISIPQNRQKFSGVIGGVMMILGIVIYLAPAAETAPESSKEMVTSQPDQRTNKVDLDKITPVKDVGTSSLSDGWQESDGSFDSNWSQGDFNLGDKTVKETLIDYTYRFSGTFQKDGWVYQNAPYSPSKDLYLGVDFHFRDTNNQSATGILFRKTYKTYFALSISKTRSLSLSYYDGQKWSVIVDWIWLPKLDLTRFNRLEVVAKGSKVAIYMNKRLIQEVDVGDKGNLSGNVALYIQSYAKNAADVTVDFKNITYRH